MRKCRYQCCCANDADHTWKDDPVRAGRICLIFTEKYTNTEWLSNANTLENMSTDTQMEKCRP